ncbi:unnamed protein product [Gordionus sp. m RMFG-2023]
MNLKSPGASSGYLADFNVRWGNALNPNIVIEKSILDTLFNNYDKRVRPGTGKMGNITENDPAIVTVNMYLRSISKIDDVSMEYSIQLTFREEWNDERLRFDNMGKIEYINLPTMDNIWQPDLFFGNEKNAHFHDMLVRNLLLRVYPNGNILYSVRISLLLSCPMSLEYYPLDNQRCYIEMISYAYTTRDIIFVWKEDNPIQIIKNLHLPSFSLERTHTSYCTSKTNTGEYSCLRVELLLRREFSYYMLQLYIPSFMLVIVSWVSFWLDKESVPGRISIGVTTLLTMATQSSGINAKLPPVSYTKAIDIWIGSCLTFIFGALLEFALVNYTARMEALQAANKAKNGNNFKKVAEDHTRSTTKSSEAQDVISNEHSRMIDFESMGTTYGETNDGGFEDETEYCKCGAPLSSRDKLYCANGGGKLYGNGSYHDGMHEVFKGRHDKTHTLNDYNTQSEVSFMLPSASMSYDTNNHVKSKGSKRKLNRSQTMSEYHMGSEERNKMEEGYSMMNSSYPSSTLHQPPIITNKRSGGICFHSFMKKYKSRSKRIDVLSRIFFPLAFTGFNIVYWVAYMV